MSYDLVAQHDDAFGHTSGEMNGKQVRGQYTQEFKPEAVRLVKTGCRTRETRRKSWLRTA